MADLNSLANAVDQTLRSPSPEDARALAVDLVRYILNRQPIPTDAASVSEAVEVGSLAIEHQFGLASGFVRAEAVAFLEDVVATLRGAESDTDKKVEEAVKYYEECGQFPSNTGHGVLIVAMKKVAKDKAAKAAK